uniref:PTS sugar transporter subunit IIA n=2 Tax=Weissella soli TaxID=155866 RepID=UPI0035A145A4
MNIQDLLAPEVMILDLQATTKRAALKEIIASLYNAGKIRDEQEFLEGILAREAQTTTGLGEGIAMPHSKNAAVLTPTIAFARSAKGVDYDALDGQPVELFFMIAVPTDANDTHLQALANLSRYLLQDGFMAKSINSSGL